MAYELDKRLVVGVASSALFDLAEADAVFRDQGEEAYRVYQERHLDDTLDKGVAFPFIRRLLSLNDLSPDDPLVEVIVLSRNDPDTGLRVMRSIQSHGLSITRAIFMQGRSPYHFMPALNMSLFLSANAADVREAVALGLPAGQVLGRAAADDESDDQDLRIAFDFDGVLADDASEQVYQADGIEGFRSHETMNAATPHDPGPLRDFLANVNRLQQREEEQRTEDADYKIRVHVSLVTARNAPAHERAVRSLKGWGVTVNDAFFLGGIDKSTIMGVLKPHIFFDDQVSHLTGTSRSTPSVHVPFGAMNAPPSPAPTDAPR
ncbi:5'-nucleotidase [Streptomyces mangrovisoli]|uniref:5'-nucleotidase n=1 Tax=Streptomyces mangrovisoli TaxID=1428628 RepID=UPI000ABEFEBB|nr:5'-nucleotidase [Streptomyces mangrovisoli]